MSRASADYVKAVECGIQPTEVINLVIIVIMYVYLNKYSLSIRVLSIGAQ